MSSKDWDIVCIAVIVIAIILLICAIGGLL